MKKTIGIIGIAALLLSGCSGTNEPKKEPIKALEETETDISTTGTQPAAGAGFDVKTLSIQAQNGEKQRLDVLYEEKETGVKTRYVDEARKKTLADQEALREMEPLLQGLNVSSDTPEIEVNQQISAIFDAENQYPVLEVKIRYPDGIEKGYRFD